MRGDLRPGDPLREVELSDSLQVSRTTIREALLKLHEEKIVEIIPHRGAIVPKLSKQTAKEVFTLRAILEPYALRLAMEMDAYSVEDKNALAELAIQLNDLERVEELIFENVTTDIELHELICSRCNHRLLLDTLRPLQVLTWFYVTNFTDNGSVDYPSTPTHLAMVEAIIEGKANEATALLEMIISSRGATLLTKIEESS